MLLAVVVPLLSLLGLILYIRWNDVKISYLPSNASFFSPIRISRASVQAMSAKLAKEQPTGLENQLPSKTGRRYIVVGGGGFLGGWIVSQLLDRGEDPSRIRIIDLFPSARTDFKTGPASRVAFLKADISDRAAVDAAFRAPWPRLELGNNVMQSELTVFHTAATIRFYERHPDLMPRSAKVNVQGTQNVVDAARAVGASVFVYTSSGSVCVRRSRFWLWPWEREPHFFVQVINDVDDAIFPKQHDQFFSNYAVAKIQAEKIVRAADKSTSDNGNNIMRTGCLRPGNGIFGPGDTMSHSYLGRSVFPMWSSNILQSFVYVENCAAAHLCYEQRLIELSQPSCKNPDIGGDAFAVADPGPPATFDDFYTTLEILNEGTPRRQRLSPTIMLLLSHLIELYYCTREVLGSRYPILQLVMPPAVGDMISLQPPLFALTQVHLIFDDSRARLPPEKGGLGYQGAWTTIEALHRTYDKYKMGFTSNHNSRRGGFTLESNLFEKRITTSHLTMSDPPVKTPVEVALAN